MPEPALPDPIDMVLDAEDWRPSTRLVIGALYTATEPLTRVELAERAGVHRQTVKEATDALNDADRVAVDTRVTGGPGRHPRTYRLRVACPECGRRFRGREGVTSHYGHEHATRADDLLGRAGEHGADPTPPPTPEGHND